MAVRYPLLMAVVPAALLALACVRTAGGAAAPDIPKPRPKIANAAWAGVLKEHPRLLGPREHLRALARSKPDLYREIRADSPLLAAGIAHAVEGLPPEQIERRVRAAKAVVAKGVTDVHQDTWIGLTDVALTYDLFHEAVSPEDRRAMVEWMNPHLEKFRTDEGAFHNSTLSKILCYLRVAYATWGENPRAQEFRDYAIEKLYEGKVVPVLREFGDGGGYTECGWYTRGSLWHLVQALELARRVEGYDGFQQAPRFFYQRLAYEMLQPYPGLHEYGSERFAVEGDGAATYGGHREYPRHTRTVLAQYFRGSELAGAVMNKRRKGSNSAARLVDFLYEEEPDEPLDLARFPWTHLAAGIGKVYARGDWSDDATWFRFECGDYWNGHQHFEVGNFEIFRREPLATESGEYHDYLSNHAVNWLLRTIAHNGILVYQPGEEWSRMRDGGRNRYANDGGQAKKWDWTTGDLPAWQAKREQFERGDIVAYDSQPEFLYVAGDGTKAYSPAKLSQWVRQIVFLRPHTFVIFDRVVSTRPEYEKTWLLHCRNEPELQGDRVTITAGKGRLQARTLLPGKPVVRKVEGYTYRGETFDPPRNSQTPLAERWRVEVLPPEAQTEDLFLHVLSTDEMPATRLLREGARVGVQVGNARVLFEGAVGGTLALAGREHPLRAEVRRGRYE